MNSKRTTQLWLALISAILLASFCLPTAGDQPPARADEEEHELDPRDVVTHAKISLRQAMQHALKAQPGIAVEAVLEGEVEDEKTEIFYEVMIVSHESLYEVKLDPASGGILEKTRVTDAEELQELRAFKAVLRHTDLTLDQLVASAEAIVKGHVVATTLLMDDEGPECEVFFANGRYLIEASLEARAGHLIELELVGLEEDEDDEEGEHEDEDDDEDDDDEEGEDDEDDEDEEEEEEDEDDDDDDE